MLPGGVEGGGEVVEEVGGKKKEKKALFTINESFGTLVENGGFRGHSPVGVMIGFWASPCAPTMFFH